MDTEVQNEIKKIDLKTDVVKGLYETKEYVQDLRIWFDEKVKLGLRELYQLKSHLSTMKMESDLLMIKVDKEIHKLCV